ncbi:hypothetical protein [Halovenus marina]|uniref:hypothetical protein n=1 Tax=Halovenus marina TaxID=3396621 RepID=UPI003F542DCE
MDRARLADALASSFDGSDSIRRAVTRQARDLDDVGWIERDLGYELTVDAVISNLDDAPDEYSLAERWNWWIGSLELSHGGYDQFRVRPDIDEQ